MKRAASHSSAPSCPCRVGQPIVAHQVLPTYEQCCGRYIEQWPDALAPDAEHLMRSRYTAFVRERADYLLQTWHPSTRPAALDFEPQAQWLGLEVKRHVPGDADRSEVEFVARYRVHGRAVRLHERSRFVREHGQWFYLDGDFPGSRP